MFWWGGSVPTYALSYTLPTMVSRLSGAVPFGRNAQDQADWHRTGQESRLHRRQSPGAHDSALHLRHDCLHHRRSAFGPVQEAIPRHHVGLHSWLDVSPGDLSLPLHIFNLADDLGL
jgi:hypothetical protein